jgi:RNA polymerase sigma factor (sigma-70 family)
VVPASDQLLFDRWQAGDRQAGEELCARHQPVLEGFFGRRAPQNARDLVQEAWFQCLKSHDSYRGEASFRTFLFAIARHVLCRHLRQSRRDETDFAVAELPMSQPSPLSLLQRRHELGLLAEAFRELADEHQLVLELAYDQQLDSRAIGDLLQQPSATVRTRLRRARELLREGVERLAAVDPGLRSSALQALEIWAGSQPSEADGRGPP